MERESSSPACGELVCPIIFLWDSPSRDHVIAVAEHNTKCEILEKATIKDGSYSWDYFHVKPTRAEWVGKLRRLRGMILGKAPSGWVSAPFLLAYGRWAT